MTNGFPLEADIFKHHTVCRACGNANLIPVFDLGIQPLANAFTKLEDDQPGFAPLQVLHCDRCTLAQLSVVVDPAILYSSYNYVTSKSQTMQRHFMLLVDAIRQECNPDSLIEVGSNNGDFLKFCKERGVHAVLGIDPAENLQPDFAETGISSVCGLFDTASVSIARTAIPSVDVIVARHVFAHVDNWHEFINNLDSLANKNTLIVIEVPYLVDTLDRVELDQAYHEHLSYVTVKSVMHLLEGTVFHLHKVVRFDIHGGAIVLMIRRNDHHADFDSSVTECIKGEDITLGRWARFESEARRRIVGLRRQLASFESVCGFGASAKSTVWINACGFTEKDIQFICDCTLQKQGKHSPGSRIPILPESDLMDKSPDCAVIFAWNFAMEIMENNQAYTNAGGTFIIPGEP